jgi:glycosyltransferase involved in cell wall biosynthesis
VSPTNKPLRVALNAVAARPGGGLSYLLNQIPLLDDCVDLTVFVGRTVAGPLCDSLTGLTVQQLPRWASPLPLRLFWEHVVFPYLARDADVLYSIGTFASLTRRKPQVVVVLIPYVFGPEGQQVIEHTRPPLSFKARVLLQRLLGRLTISRATVLVATSRFTASQIRYSAPLGVDVRVVPIAGAEIPKDESPPEPNSFNLSRPYALSVGSDPPHKDQLGLVQSWPVNSELDLVLAGTNESIRSSQVEAAVHGRDDIHWLGPIDGYGRLFQLYRDASVVVAHSLLEGFGMTPLEAMAQGTPVVASDIPAHREVCGDAALYYDPSDRTQLFAAIQRILREPDLAETLVSAGKERLTRFSWADNGEAMCDIFHEVGRRKGVVSGGAGAAV